MTDDIRTITAPELKARIDRGDEFKLVNALGDWEFRAKHIPGSLHLEKTEDAIAALRPDDEVYDFYVVVAGSVETVTGAGTPDEQWITTHGAGRFLGELNLLTGLRVFVTARVVEAGEVIVVPHDELKRLIAVHPQLSDL